MTCKAISNGCSNFFSPLKPIGTCSSCVSTAIKVGAYFTIVFPLLAAVTWGGAEFCSYLFTEAPEVTEVEKQDKVTEVEKQDSVIIRLHKLLFPEPPEETEEEEPDNITIWLDKFFADLRETFD